MRLSQMIPQVRTAWLVATALLFAAACAEAPPSESAAASGERGAGDLSLGVFRIDGSRGVIDGDTIRVVGIDEPLRLIGLDTEERYSGDDERRRAESDFERYAKERRGNRSLPVKYGTPSGEEAAAWARRFFERVSRVRVEFDRTDRTRGYFERYLVHVFAIGEGGERHFNVEAVRAGMSPYFTKYGRSLRFDDALRHAQDEARRAGLGVWAAGARSYPDYGERLAWWNDRASAIADFDEPSDGEALPRVSLLDDGALARLEGLGGREVALFGEIGPSSGEGPPYDVFLSHRRGRDMLLRCDDRAELRRVAPSRLRGRYVVVRGLVGVERGRPLMRARDVSSIERP